MRRLVLPSRVGYAYRLALDERHDVHVQRNQRALCAGRTPRGGGSRDSAIASLEDTLSPFEGDLAHEAGATSRRRERRPCQHVLAELALTASP